VLTARGFYLDAFFFASAAASLAFWAATLAR
jgi:hypothetical protein